MLVVENENTLPTDAIKIAHADPQTAPDSEGSVAGEAWSDRGAGRAVVGETEG
jgi:hypothetical protein